MPELLNGLLVQVGAQSCEGCTIQLFSSSRNIPLQALRSGEVSVTFHFGAVLCSREGLCVWDVYWASAIASDSCK